MDTKSKTISESLLHGISDSGKTAYRIAKDTGINHCSLRRFILGQRTLRLDAVDKLAQYLGLSCGKSRF